MKGRGNDLRRVCVFFTPLLKKKIYRTYLESKCTTKGVHNKPIINGLRVFVGTLEAFFCRWGGEGCMLFFPRSALQYYSFFAVSHETDSSITISQYRAQSKVPTNYGVPSLML